MTNKNLQKLIDKECKQQRQRGRQIWLTPQIIWFPISIREYLRENPELVPHFVESYVRLEHDY